MKTIFELATELANAVTADIDQHGGLTSDTTIRKADELRLAISRHRKRVGLTDDDINLMIDYAGMCSQHLPLIEDEAVRECIRLNVHKLGWSK